MLLLILATVVALGVGIAVSFLADPVRLRWKAGLATAGVIWGLGWIGAGLTVVSASHVGIVTEFGQVQQETLQEGLHVVKPWSRVHEVFIGLDVAKLEQSEAASKDLQAVHTSFTLNYRVDPQNARALYAMAPSLQYEGSYVQPAMYEAFKAVAARYTAEQLITKREEVSTAIRDALSARLRQYGITAQAINITNFGFSKSFNEAIEAKVTASQQAEKAERDLVRIKFEAEQKIASAKGQAEAIRIQAEAVKSQGGKEYVQLEAIKKWDGKLPVYTGGQAPLPFIDVSK